MLLYRTHCVQETVIQETVIPWNKQVQSQVLALLASELEGLFQGKLFSSHDAAVGGFVQMYKITGQGTELLFAGSMHSTEDASSQLSATHQVALAIYTV